MIEFMMGEELSLEIILPAGFNQQHYDALLAYLKSDQYLDPTVWRHLFQGVDLLNEAHVVTQDVSRTFRQVYDQLIDRPFADQFIAQLLATKDISKESPGLTAQFARQIKPILQEAGLLHRDAPLSILLQGFCLYWWQSFARGYAFEVFIMRDLEESGIAYQMHDLRRRVERYSPADLIVQGLLGDIKTSVYLLQWQFKGQLPNDFYISRLYAQGQERTIVVFQKPLAWDAIDGGLTVPGTLDSLTDLLPTPVQIEVRGIMLIVVEYETWKQKVRHKQASEG
jgi:hypothetical protein